MSNVNGKMSNVSFVFFGTDGFSVIILDELKKAGLVPALVVTVPDRPKGRGLKLAPPPAKLWAQENNVQFLQPPKLDDALWETLGGRFDLEEPAGKGQALRRVFHSAAYELFIVASYGKIIPARFIDLPAHGALNVHPSLLPLYRGPSPIEAQILDNAPEVGVSIMKMDEKMDHGPILAQKHCGKLGARCSLEERSGKRLHLAPRVFHSATYTELRDALAHLGGELLVETIPKWLAGEIEPREQEHDTATYTKKITKEDGLIDLEGDPELNYRKFLAYTPWPSVYFFAERNNKKLRVKITDAELVRPDLEEGRSPGKRSGLEFVIKKVIPEGKKEVPYSHVRH